MKNGGTRARCSLEIAPRLVGDAPGSLFQAFDVATVAFGWPALERGLLLGAQKRCQLFATRAARLRLAVKFLRFGRAAALVGQPEHFDLVTELADANLENVTDADRLRRLDACALHGHLAALHRIGGKATRFIKACSPQPFVDEQFVTVVGLLTPLGHSQPDYFTQST